jgi:hypothetical protein
MLGAALLVEPTCFCAQLGAAPAAPPGKPELYSYK